LKLVLITSVIATTSVPVKAQSYMENLSRGLVAVKTNNGYFLSWRLLGHEDYQTAFNVYKDSQKLNNEPITNATCYEDKSSGSGEYSVRAIVNGVELQANKAELTLSTNYVEIPLQNASGYNAGDASCGDLDGDGVYEIILKEEKNPQDNSNDGVTGEPKLSAINWMEHYCGRSIWV
jgi:rhamnogalacturonan endolyase